MAKPPYLLSTRSDTVIEQFRTYLLAQSMRTIQRQGIATIDPQQSARTTWTRSQLLTIAVLILAFIVSLIVLKVTTFTIIFSVVTVLYLAMLALSTAWIVAVSRTETKTVFNDETIAALETAPWPNYTILCPLYKEARIVPQFVRAMRQLDYPTENLQVLFLVEQHDTQTRAALLAMNLPSHFQVVTVPPGPVRTKPNACNYGLKLSRGDYVVIYDAEDVPEPTQLKKAILTFASSPTNVVCTQARLNFYNPMQNILTRFFTIEYSFWFDLILPGLQRLGFSLPLGGTSNHFKMSALKALGAWDAYNVTEDADLGLRLAQYNDFKTVILDSTTYEEANSRVRSWIKQRSRWIKGYMQTYLVHTRHPLKELRKGKTKDTLSLHLFVGAGSIILLINPIMWAMFAVYLIWRPVDLYHQLFPWPVLYAGMLCFLLGNFMPMYTAMIGCMQRKQYALVKWCLLLPFYWLLGSIAALMAGYELLVKPHKWHKTSHGLHLKNKMATDKIMAISIKVKAVSVSSARKGTITSSVKAISTMIVPAINTTRKKRRVRALDIWGVLTLFLASLCSVGATLYYYVHHETLLYADAQAHIRLARSLFDSRTPGFAQLGQVWLPLHHLFIVPFVWNDFLWRTGLAGVIPAMIAYVIGARYAYGIMKHLTGNASISFIVVLGYITNPNLLYLQSTPLSDTFCVCFFAISCYYFVLWVQRDKVLYFSLMSVSVWCITLIRYDGWALAVCTTGIIGVVCLLKKYRLHRIVSTVVVYSSIAFTGIGLWMLWCKIIDGSFFFFQSGPYSSQAMQMELLSNNALPTYHHILLDIQTYFADAYDNTGVLYFLLAPLSILFIAFAWKKRTDYIVILIALIPFLFYILTLYSGQSVIYVPGYIPKGVIVDALFNSRYGIQALIPILLLTACLFVKITSFIRYVSLKYLFALFCIITILTQSYMILHTIPITTREGWQQCSYALPLLKQENIYFEEHYDGGGILTDIHASGVDPRNFGADLSQLVDESNDLIWKNALIHPDRYVHWIAYNPQNTIHDGVAKSMAIQNNLFMSKYRLVLRSPTGVQIYLLKTITSLPTRPLPQVWIEARQWCNFQGA